MTEKCNQKTEVYSRIVGYFRPIQQWNPGKLEEYKERVVFKIKSEATQEEKENGKNGEE